MQEESWGRGELSRPHGSTCKGPGQRECGLSRTQGQCDGSRAVGDDQGSKQAPRKVLSQWDDLQTPRDGPG